MKCMPSTRSGRVVAAPSTVIEIDDVFEARITSGRVDPSSRANSVALGVDVFDDRFDDVVDVGERVERRCRSADAPSAASRSAGRQRALLDELREALVDRRARALERRRRRRRAARTSKPACANTWAMPLPIVPAPTTPTVLIASGCIPIVRAARSIEARSCDRAVRSTSARPPARRRCRRRGTASRCRASRLPALQRVEQRRQHARAARADRVTERDGAAVDVDARRIDAELAQ